MWGFGYQTITRLKPKFVALHFQESGGKESGEESLQNVKEFVRYKSIFSINLSHYWTQIFQVCC